jgi:hypothetical protein
MLFCLTDHLITAFRTRQTFRETASPILLAAFKINDQLELVGDDPAADGSLSWAVTMWAVEVTLFDHPSYRSTGGDDNVYPEAH